MERRGKMTAVLLALAALALLGFAPTRVWAIVEAAEIETFTVTGAELAPALPALALVVGAVTLALVFARRRLAMLIGAMFVLVGVLASVLALGVSEQAAAVRSGVESRSGVTHVQPSSFEIDAVMQWLTVVGAVLAVAAGVWIEATSHRWPTPAKAPDRYDARSGALAWDVLDEGEDPTLDASPDEPSSASMDPGHRDSV